VVGPLAALLAAALETSAAARSPTEGKRLLFVINTKPYLVLPLAKPGLEADGKIKQHLESLGFVVTIADQHDPATRADGYDLVVISATVSGGVVEGAYKHVAAPVVTWESHIYDDMGMAGKRLERDFGEVKKEGELERYVRLTNAPHSLAAGLQAGTVMAMDRDDRMNWGRPGPGAIVVATLPGAPDKATIFAYEKGATMEDAFIAPARRVGFFLSNETFPTLTNDGLALFDAALRWAVTRPCHASVAASASSRKVLLVASEGPEAAVDGHIKARLESLGLVVVPAAAAENADLVVISSSFREREKVGRYERTAVPVVTLATPMLGDMGLTGGRRDLDFGEVEEDRHLWFVNAQHPLSAGLPAGILVKVCRNGSPPTTWCERIGWGRPGPGALVAATVPGESEKAAVFAYEKGATMPSGILAPARRVALTFFGKANFDNLNPDGLALFDAGIRWAAGTPCE